METARKPRLRITRLRVVEYRGVEAVDIKIPEAGGVFRGANGAGKTSLLNAIRAALAARDIGPDAIRLGAERAEILIDLGAVSVQRVITAEGTKLTVRDADGKATITAPQKYLADMLGTAAIDPIELFLERKKDRRRALVLAAIPIRMTEAQLRGWVGDHLGLLAQMGQSVPSLTSMHGLDACAAVRKAFYDCRTECNRRAKEEAGVAEVATKELEAYAGKVLPDALGEAEAQQRADHARSAHERLLGAAGAAYASSAQATKSREAVARLRSDAETHRKTAAGHRVEANSKLPALTDSHTAALARIRELELEITRVKEERDTLAGEIQGHHGKLREAEAADKVADASARQADELEQAIAGIASGPSGDEIAAAAEALRLAEAMIADARNATAAKAIRAKVDHARAEEADFQKRSALLTKLVDHFTKAAPAALLLQSQGIPGLSIDEEGEILLNGVRMDALSGREQLVFATEIARKANAKAKFLIVDGLERLDPDQLPVFIRAATRDGYQLIATRVASGGVEMDAVELDDEAATAAEGATP